MLRPLSAENNGTDERGAQPQSNGCTVIQFGWVDRKNKYVDGDVHANGAENYWSMIKRRLKDTYISVEPWHLFRYLNEHCFRFNERKLSDSERFKMVLGMVSGKRLTYDKLTSESPAY